MPLPKLAHIIYQGGTHGHFLIYFLDRFSSLTPPIKELPFTDNGTSHVEVNYSKKFIGEHEVGEAEGPMVLITIDPTDILYLERIVNERAGDLKIDVNSDFLSDDHLEQLGWRQKLKTLYNITDNIVPRCVKRDLYKMGFLDVEQFGFLTQDKFLKSKMPKDTVYLPVSSFWDKAKFQDMIWRLDEKLNLEIKNVDWSVYDEFYRRLQLIHTRLRVERVIKCIEKNQEMDLTELDVVEEAYISAYLEKNNKFINVPFMHNFFTNTTEIDQWLKTYPQHYKAMNPNLPTFNGIANPYHLAKLKK